MTDGVNRRALLALAGLAGAAILSACATDSRAPSPSVPGSARTPSSPGAATPTPEPTPSPTPTPTAAAVDPAAVAARFAGVAPVAWGMEVAGVRPALVAAHSASGAPRVALTFDACGGDDGGGIDQALIDGLRAEGIPVTLFLNQRWIHQHPELAAELAADPLFLIANHGTRHVPLSVTGRDAYGIAGTRSAAEAVDEVWGNHQTLTTLCGRPPAYFRAGTAHYDDVGAAIALALGETPIGFTVNGDGGATFASGTVRAEVARAEAGGIVLAHMNQPSSGTAAGALAAAGDLRRRGVELVHVDG